MQPPPDWRSRAAAALLLAPDQLSNAESALSALPAEQQARARALVQAVAWQPADLDGFTGALQRLAEGLPSLSSEPSKGGDPPAIAAAKLAALSALQGLAVLAGKAVASGEEPRSRAVALLAAIDAAEDFRPGQRSVLRSEARQGLGDDLYIQALQA